MTSPQPIPSVPEGATSQLPADALNALIDAVGRENGAVWAYGLISAYAPEDAALIEGVRSVHLARRDQASAIVSNGGGTPPAPAPSYTAPAITDVATARDFAIAVEIDCGYAWYGVIGSTDIPELRSMALAGLTDTATTATRFRMLAGAPKVTQTFPGRP